MAAALGSGYPEFAAANRSSKRHFNEVWKDTVAEAAEWPNRAPGHFCAKSL
jgi:hypothetical protein